MRVHIRARGNGHQPLWGTAFKKGLERHGHTVTIGPNYQPCDLLVLWGVHSRDLIDLQNSKGKVCILERGYLGERFEYTSVSFNGKLNNRAEFHSAHSDPSRFNDLVTRYGPFPGYERASFGPGPVLLIGQKPGDQSHRHVKIDKWYQSVTETLTNAGLKVKFRAHPLDQTTVVRRAPLAPLHEDLADARYVVTLNSNTGVEALAYGRPVVTCDEGAMAYPITSHDVAYAIIPGYEERQRWFHELAWKQWTLSEMESGECWEAQRLNNLKEQPDGRSK
jgi:hypothetical protein